MAPDVPCPTVHNITLACDDPLPALDVRAEPPNLDDGWACTIDHDDEAPREFFKLYRHADGRLGYHWRWPLPDWDHQYVIMQLHEPGRIAWAAAAYQNEGFAEYLVAPQGQEGIAGVSVMALRLDEYVAGQWRPIEGARLDIGIVDEVGYYVWSWSEDGQAVHFDITRPHEERVWAPVNLVQQINGRPVSSALVAPGIGFEAQYWGIERTLANDCAMDTLPGGIA